MAGIPDRCVYAVLGTDALYLLSRRDAPHGKVLRLPLTDGATVAGAHEIVPASDYVIADLAVTRGTVWVVGMDGGPQHMRAFDTSGRSLPPVEIPPMSSVSSYSGRLSTLGEDRIAWSCISLVPRFDPQLLLWLEQGGVYVVANIRGGGEYGEQWHHAGRLAMKQNCFDDFIACADHLHHSRITSRERLAIMGGSNGGLLMGAVLTQRPGIARAVVAEVPVMDSLRAETTINGRFNTTEFGTVEDPELFMVLLGYSPYHNVVDGTAYPAVLLTAGENDTRVAAWHAKKMTARLQEATSSDRPVLLRLTATGHLTGSLDQTIDEATDWHAFLFDQLGLGYRLAALA